MANTHIGVNENAYYGRLLRTYMSQLQQAYDGLQELRDAMTLMINGDGTSDTHYPDMTTKFGWANDALSHAAYNELVALLAKITVDTSVTVVKTQILQTIAKFK